MIFSIRGHSSMLKRSHYLNKRLRSNPTLYKALKKAVKNNQAETIMILLGN